VVVLFVVAAAGPLGSGPADAARPLAAPGRGGGCPAGALCVWTAPGFAGHLTIYQNGAWDGRCQPVKSVGSVTDLTANAPWRMELFVFHARRHADPCSARGVYAHYTPGQTDPAVPGGPATGIRIYADPNPSPTP
jgi:hypothetical protein